MHITYDPSGTTQQLAWARQAIASCSYPLDGLDARVTVQWAAGAPCHVTHPYMCTVHNDDGTFTITIEPWADDPSNPNLRGLPNPAGDIKDFYMQSLVHEIGHVVQDVFLATDDKRQAASALFWKAAANSATGRRYGALADYAPAEASDTAWADAIQEAIAECFKCGCYKGRLIYENRTSWKIDAQEWPALWHLLAAGGSGNGFYDDLTAFQDTYTNITTGSGTWAFSPFSTPTAVGPVFPPGLSLANNDLTLTQLDPAKTVTGPAKMSIRVAFATASLVPGQPTYVGLAHNPYGDPTAETSLALVRDPATDLVDLWLDYGKGWAQSMSLGAMSSELDYLYDRWLVYRDEPDGSTTHEIWIADPEAGIGGMVLSATVDAGGPVTTPAYASLELSVRYPHVSGLLTGYALLVTDWRYAPIVSAMLPPYPFAPQYGNLAGGPGNMGAIRIGQ